MERFRCLGALCRALIVGSTLLAAACGSSGSGGNNDGGRGDGGGGNPDGIGVGTGTPADQCRTLVTTICRRGDQCSGTDGGATGLAQCQAVLGTEFGCDLATEPFGACLSDVNAVSCGTLFPQGGLAVPGSCQEVINRIPLSDAQMKCFALAGTLCTRSLMCSTGVATPDPTDVDACVASLTSDIDGIPCLLATGVSATYNQCLTDLKAAPCATPDGGAGAGTGADGGAGADGGTGMGMMNGLASCTGVIMTP